jgi:sulfonate transport system substrate-binding protein
MICVSSIVLTSCNNGSKQKKVKMATFFNAVDYGPYIIAKKKGWFDEALKEKGITVEYSQFQDLPALNEAFATNNIDIVFEAEPPAIIGKAAGNNIKIRDISCTLNQEIVVRSDSKINSVKDLEGKKIAVLAGTSSHYGVYELLKRNGITPNDKLIFDMSPPDAKIALAKGEVDAWAIWPPNVEEEEVAGTGKSFSGDEVFISSVMVTNENFVKSNPEAFKIIKETFDRAKKWLSEHPDEGINIIAEEMKEPVAVIKLAYPKHNWAAVIDDKIVSDIQAKADFLLSLGKIKNAVKVKDDLISTQQ